MQKKSSIPPYQWGHLGILILGFLAGSLLGELSYQFLTKIIHVSPSIPFRIFLGNSGAFVGSLLLYDFTVYRKYNNGIPLNFPSKRLNFSTYLLWAIAMAGCMMLADVTTELIPKNIPWLEEWYKEFEAPMRAILNEPYMAVVIICILAPLLEEIIFRGIILKALLNKGWKPVYAILLSSFLFGLIHGNPWQFIGAMIAGSALGWIYYQTKSLITPILGHALNNISVLLLYYTTQKESFAEAFGIPVYVLALIGAVLASIGYFLIKRNLRIIHLEQ